MLDHIIGYKELRDMREGSALKLIETDINNLQLFEKMLGFQYQVQKKIHPVFKDRHDRLLNGPKHTKEHLTKDITFNLCSYNIEYLFAAMESLKGGQLHAAFSTIRPVYESIPKIFYAHHSPEDVLYMFLQGWYDLERPYMGYERFEKKMNNDPMDMLEEFLSSAKKSPLTNGRNMDAKYIDKKFRKNLTNRNYRKQVYTDEQLVIQDVAYAMLSSNSHANVARFGGFAKGHTDNRSKFTKILVDLTFVNFFLLASVCCKELEQVGEGKNTSNFLIGVNEEVGDLLHATNLFPQRSKYTENLFTKPTQNISDR